MPLDDGTGLDRVLVTGPAACLALALLLRACGQRRLTKLNRFDFVVTVALGSTLASVIRQGLGRLPGVERDPVPKAIPWELAGSAVNIRVRWWCKSQRASVVRTRWEVIATMKRELTAAGIDLPFPTRVVFLHDQTEATNGKRARQRGGWPAGGQPPEPRYPSEVTVHAAAFPASSGAQPGKA